VQPHALEEFQVELLKELHGREANAPCTSPYNMYSIMLKPLMLEETCMHLKVAYVTPFATIWKLQDLEETCMQLHALAG